MSQIFDIFHIAGRGTCVTMLDGPDLRLESMIVQGDDRWTIVGLEHPRDGRRGVLLRPETTRAEPLPGYCIVLPVTAPWLAVGGEPRTQEDDVPYVVDADGYVVVNYDRASVSDEDRARVLVIGDLVRRRDCVEEYLWGDDMDFSIGEVTKADPVTRSVKVKWGWCGRFVWEGVYHMEDLEFVADGWAE